MNSVSRRVLNANYFSKNGFIFAFFIESMQIHNKHKTALVISDSLTGRMVVRELVEQKNYDQVLLWTDKPMDLQHSKLRQFAYDPEQTPEEIKTAGGHDLFFCQSHDFFSSARKLAFQRRAFSFPLKLAITALDAGVNQCVWLSVAGANPKATLFFYEIMGQMEVALKKLPFWSIHIFRPGLPAQSSWWQLLNRVVQEIADEDYVVPVDHLAREMVKAAQGTEEGIFSYSVSYLQKSHQNYLNLG
jgi:hypothetical protein